ncbi:MAG: TolC family protein [Acidobacteria bacterium]|nr:TolC family protein [Acidobacteriota bacterium]
MHVRRTCLSVVLAAAAVCPVSAQSPAAGPPQPPATPALAQPQGPGAPPAMLTLADALDRARENDASFQTAVADSLSAREDRVQARAGLLPAVSGTTQFIGNQANGVNPNGRFVSMDGVRMYRAWGVVRQDLSPAVLTATPLQRARALEAASAAQAEIARRGLAVTVTRSYYALITAQRRFATAQTAAATAARFLDVARQQQRLGQVAMSDVIKADIQSRQLTQAFQEATLAVDAARLALAVLVSPTFSENFTVVDDLASPPALPTFDQVNDLAASNNMDVRAARASLDAARQDVRTARFAFLPTVSLEGDYGIEANEFALHSRIAAQPELGVLPNLGYAITANLTVPVWDWGGLRSRLRQTQVRTRAAQVTLTQAQREAFARLYGLYNEALVARAAVDNAREVADLAAESLRLTTLRYTAGESTALEVVDAQNTLVTARNAFDDAGARYRVAMAELQTLTGTF